MQERTPLYDDLVQHFKDQDLDVKAIVERERWSLDAAKRRIKKKKPEPARPK